MLYMHELFSTSQADRLAVTTLFPPENRILTESKKMRGRFRIIFVCYMYSYRFFKELLAYPNYPVNFPFVCSRENQSFQTYLFLQLWKLLILNFRVTKRISLFWSYGNNLKLIHCIFWWVFLIKQILQSVLVQCYCSLLVQSSCSKWEN